MLPPLLAARALISFCNVQTDHTNPILTTWLLTGLGMTHRGCLLSLCQGQVTTQHAGGPHLATVTVLACHSSLAEALAGLWMARFCPTRRTVALCQGKKKYTQLYANEVAQLLTNFISKGECYFSLIYHNQSKDRALLLLDLFLSTTYSQDAVQGRALLASCSLAAAPHSEMSGAGSGCANPHPRQHQHCCCTSCSGQNHSSLGVLWRLTFTES